MLLYTSQSSSVTKTFSAPPQTLNAAWVSSQEVSLRLLVATQTSLKIAGSSLSTGRQYPYDIV